MAWVSIERQLFSYEYDTLPLGHWTSGVFSITAQILSSSLTAINGIHTHLTPHIRWSFIYSLICAPSLGVYYFLSLTLSVHLSVCLLATNIASSFSFLDGIEPFFVHQFSMTKTTKRCSSNFELLPWQRNLGYCWKNFKLLLLFCFPMESSHFLALSSPWPLYKTLFFDFWFRPITP